MNNTREDRFITFHNLGSYEHPLTRIRILGTFVGGGLYFFLLPNRFITLCKTIKNIWCNCCKSGMEWCSLLYKERDMTKADKLRMLFPDFAGHVDVELEHMEGAHRITFINVPENIFETTFRYTEECGCCHYYDTETTELDCNEEGVNSLSDFEFEMLINEIR